MNSTTRAESSALEMQTAERVFHSIKLPEPARIVTDFMQAVSDGYINPGQMVSVLQSMHACLADRYPKVELFMTPDLEQVSDFLCKAIRCAEDDENYNPEPTKY